MMCELPLLPQDSCRQARYAIVLIRNMPLRCCMLRVARGMRNPYLFAHRWARSESRQGKSACHREDVAASEELQTSETAGRSRDDAKHGQPTCRATKTPEKPELRSRRASSMRNPISPDRKLTLVSGALHDRVARTAKWSQDYTGSA